MTKEDRNLLWDLIYKYGFACEHFGYTQNFKYDTQATECIKKIAELLDKDQKL